MTDLLHPLWGDRADIAQRSLDHFFGAEDPQFLDNAYPLAEGGNETFNYWWLAHVIDARLDAFERTGDRRWLDQAEAAYANIVERNGGSLFNDYFDDMLWFALAILRLHEATGKQSALDDARAIWEHVIEHGWNDQLGESLAWRKQQLYYKNTPANGPLVILSVRLSRFSEDLRYLDYAQRSFAWMTENLVNAADGFVEDGINREGDGRIDTQWRFTYNQGLYMGAAVELARATGNDAFLAAAVRTALTAIAELSAGGVFRDEGDGGDEGLFKGVYYRYLGVLLDEQIDPEVRGVLEGFVRDGAAALWESGFDGEYLLANNDWTTPVAGPVPYSTQLSAIMALELAARLDRD